MTTEYSPSRLPVWRRACLLLFLAFVVPPLSTITAQQQTTPSTLRVLFVGNSHTYFNNLGDIVAGIAAAGTGPKIAPTLAVRGGQSLQWHLEQRAGDGRFEDRALGLRRSPGTEYVGRRNARWQAGDS